MQHIVGKPPMSTFQWYKFCANQSSDETVMAPGSWVIWAVFFRVFPVKISAKRGKPPVNRELYVVAGVAIFPMHPGLRVNLQQVGKTLRAKAVVREKNAPNFRSIFPHFLSVFAQVFDLAPDVGFWHSWYRRKACATLFCKVLDSRKTEVGTERYGPANRDCRSVFGPSEGIFPVKIPTRPGKVLVIREFHTMHECVLFSTCSGLQINLLWVRKTLRASVVTSGEKLWNFQHNLISSTCFRARGRCSSRCLILVILTSPESLCYLLFKVIGLA